MKWRSQVPWSIATRFNHGGNLFDKGGDALVVELSGFLNEKPLAALRTDLATLGLARDEAMSETEDHVAYVSEVMHYLIAGDDAAIANLTRQCDFFARHVQPWVPGMCETIMRHPKARFYRSLAGFT